jgi:hypothetical protein
VKARLAGLPDKPGVQVPGSAGEPAVAYKWILGDLQ